MNNHNKHDCNYAWSFTPTNYKTSLYDFFIWIVMLFFGLVLLKV